MKEAGFIDIFADNQSVTPVYYDNLMVTMSSGSVSEVNAFYAYGEQITSLSITPLPNMKNFYKWSTTELQEELGLNWYLYNWRPYNPFSGRWSQPDRFSEKYYHLSPYSYTAGNPVNFIDIKGDSIWYTMNKNVITMHVTGKVLNSSNDDINTQRAAYDIAFGITSTFGGTFKMGGQKYTLKADVQLEAVTSMEDVAASDHLFNIVDAERSAGISGAVNEIGGKVINLASFRYTNDNWFSNALGVNRVRSAVHEFGHAVGLTHDDVSGWSDIMRQGYGTFLSSERMKMMMQRANSINKGSNSYMGYPYHNLRGFNYKTGRWDSATVHSIFNPSQYRKP